MTHHYWATDREIVWATASDAVPTTVSIAASLDRAGRQEPEVRCEMLLLDAARAREVAPEARSRGDYAAGSTALAAAPMLASLAGDDLVLREEAADLETMAARFAAEEVSAADAKYLRQRAYNTHRRKDAYREKLRRAPETVSLERRRRLSTGSVCRKYPSGREPVRSAY